jgi:hypothetical protein
MLGGSRPIDAGDLAGEKHSGTLRAPIGFGERQKAAGRIEAQLETELAR